jgi:hypothetical protein
VRQRVVDGVARAQRHNLQSGRAQLLDKLGLEQPATLDHGLQPRIRHELDLQLAPGALQVELREVRAGEVVRQLRGRK